MSEDSKMVKLYRMISGYLRYHEAYVIEGTLTERWGMVGEYGTEKEMAVTVTAEHPALYHIEQVLAPARERGFIEIPRDELATLCIEFDLENWHLEERPLDYRNRLIRRLDNELGWTGLGHVDGGSIGMGTMEIFCEVVDYELTQITLEHFLEFTEFAIYNRMFQVGFDEEPDF